MSSKPVKLGTANIVPVLGVAHMAPEMLVNQNNNQANGSNEQRNDGLYLSTHYVSQGAYTELNKLQLPKRQSDLYADVFGDLADDNNKDINNIRTYVQEGLNKLCDTVGNRSISAEKLRRRDTQMSQAGTDSKDIYKKSNDGWFRGNMTKSLLPVVMNAIPFIKNVAVFQFSYSDIIEPTPGVTETVPGKHFEINTRLLQEGLSPFQYKAFPMRVAGTAAFAKGIKTIHDKFQPEYFTGLGDSRKNMALLAEKFRQDSAETANTLNGGDTAAALVREYGEDGRLFLKKLMNEADLSAYNYMQALQNRPTRFMQPDEQLAESKTTSESLQFMFARYEEARFINTFGKGKKQPVVEEWRPSAAFPGIDGKPIPVVKASRSEDAQSSSRARHDERAQVDFDSIERWDYSPDWRVVLDHIERNARSMANWKEVKSFLNDSVSAAKKGDTNVLLEVAELCEKGALGIPKGEEASRFARQLYTAAANKGNINAQYRLGLLHADKRFTGLDGLRNDNVAVDWLTKAAEQGHPEAQAELGLMYATGRSGLDDYEATILAHTWCRSAVKAGVRRPDVFFTLGRLYQSGMIDTPTEKGRTAIMEKWYLAAVKEGHVGAMRELGLEHLKGTSGLIGWNDGGSKGANDIDAAKYLQMAAEKNDPEALYYLGEMYLNKRASIENLTEMEAAAPCFERAADNGFAPAQFRLGQIEHGYQKAARRFAQAAKQGHIQAQCELARLYVEGVARPEDGKSQIAAALDLYKQAANKGSLDAQWALAKLYEAGQGDTKPGAPTNHMIAKYLELAASHEEANPFIAYKLAELYAQRTSGLESGWEGDKLAVKWYTQAASNGLVDAQYKLAHMYLEKGRVDDLTDQERVALAEQWYVKAANAGHEEAQLGLGLLHLTRTPGLRGTGKTQANDADAARYLQMAAEQNNLEANYFLGEMYLSERASAKGLTTKEAAVNCLKLAADNGFAPAQFRLGQMLASGETEIKNGEPDYQGAAHRFVEAAKQGHIGAQCELASLFLEKRANPSDGKSPDAAAEDLYEQAANKGSVVAQWELVKLNEAKAQQSIERGSAVDPVVDQKIAKYLELATKNGSANAQYKLASRHLISHAGLPAGAEAERKATDAFELLKQAAQQEYPKACYGLGYMYEQPSNFGLPQEPDFEKATKQYRVAAENGIAMAQYRLGMLYYEHKAAPEGVDEQGARNVAKRLFKLADAQGHVHGSFYYGLMLVQDGSGSGDPEALKGRRLMEKAAGKGDPDLQYMLANYFFRYNRDAKKSLIEEGIKWLEKAAVQGHEQALRGLEKLCIDKQLSPAQIKRARGYFEKAADERNDGYSMRFLGWMYEVGFADLEVKGPADLEEKELADLEEKGLLGLKPNHFLAFSWYYKAAEKIDDAYTFIKLGALTEAGRNPKIRADEENEQAIKYYQQAADKGSDEAMYALGKMYEKVRGGLTSEEVDQKTFEYYQQAANKGSDKAMDALKQAATKGNANAMYALGKLYATGRGGLTGEKADQEAIECYQKAATNKNIYAKPALEQVAAKGNAKAMYALGWLYENGHGGLQGEAANREAIKCYKEAADKGNAEAMYALGEMYEKGRGGLTGEEADQNAVEYYLQAAIKGNAQAMYALSLLFAAGRGGMTKKKDANDAANHWYEEAIKCYKEAAAKGNAEALFGLGKIYATGRGSQPGKKANLKLAIKYYKEAAAKGNTKAKDALEDLKGKR